MQPCLLQANPGLSKGHCLLESGLITQQECCLRRGLRGAAVGDSAGTFMLKARSDPLRCCDDRDECLQMALTVWSTSAGENQGGIERG